MSDNITDEQIGDALRAAHKQVSVWFDVLLTSDSSAWRLNAAADALAKIEAIIGKPTVP